MSHRHVGCRRCTKLDNLINAMGHEGTVSHCDLAENEYKNSGCRGNGFRNPDRWHVQSSFFFSQFCVSLVSTCLATSPRHQTVGDDTRCFLHSHNVWWRLVMFLSSLQFFITRMQVCANAWMCAGRATDRDHVIPLKKGCRELKNEK